MIFELAVCSCQLWNPKLKTRNFKPETRNPKLETRNLKPGYLYILSVFLVSMILLPRAAFAESCSTSECHPDIARGKVVHVPAEEGRCLNCHQKVNSAHPSGETADFVLAIGGGALCYACHDEENFRGKYEHGPSASGACLYCHGPHASDQKSLLRRPLEDLCLSCHSDFGLSLEKAAFVHFANDELDCGACHVAHSGNISGLLKGETTTLCLECHTTIEAKYKRSLRKHKPLYTGGQCANCHSAHFSDYHALLVNEDSALCLSCHGGKQTDTTSSLRNVLEEIEGKKVVHAPLDEEGCGSCHDPHGSSHDKILIGPYPGTVYASYSNDRYDLCFNCHDKELLTSPITSEATAFRNGKVNLHHLHVTIDRKGRTCKACHSSHASDGRKLINPEGIPFGNWKIPIRFETIDTGGSCVPGCHQAMVYDRENAYDNSKKD